MAVSMAWVRTYANLVLHGRRTIEQVPELYRQAVIDYLAEQA